MKTKEKLNIIRKRIEAVNSKDWTTWDSLHADQVTKVAPELAEPLVGAENVRRAMELTVAAFPDYRLEVSDAFGEGDWLCVEMTALGTHSGVLNMGFQVFQPTFRPFESRICSIFGFSGSKISTIREYYDLLGFIGQLGIGR
jgi:ketosteroid isomerase-like protein